MRWIVGIDLRDDCRGALNMASWLARHGSAGETCIAVHVLEEGSRGAVRDDLVDDVVAGDAEVLHSFLNQSGVSDPFATQRIVLADSVEAGLVNTAKSTAADGLLLGRLAGRGTRTPLRLGRTARRVLRHLPTLVMIVPPDLGRREIGGGAVVLATDLRASSSAAARVARRLATELGRELVVVHVDPVVRIVPTFGEVATVPLDQPLRIPADVDDWASAHELGMVRTILAQGDVLDNLLAIARQEDAPLLVAGSRRLSLADRIVTSSVGTDLARLADRAVLVVPPD